MKKLIIGAIVATSISMGLNAQTISIYKSNGDIIKYNVEDVEKMIIHPAVPEDPSNLLSPQYVPSEGFRNWIDTHLGNGSGYYSLEQAAAYTGKIDLSRESSVTDITGIEYFTGLTELIAEDSYIGNFDAKALKSLVKLKVVNTRMNELDLTGLENLRYVGVSRNKLTSLILPHNAALESLYCDTNELTELDLNGCTGLKTLVCSFNKLMSITLPDCRLETLAVHENPLVYINLEDVIGTLDFVNVAACKFTALDFTGGSKLTYIECGENPFESAPIFAGCKKLETLRMEDVASIELGNLDFTECTKLNVLRLDRSHIGTSLDLTSNRYLYELSVQGCGLQEIGLSGLINLGYVNVSDNNFERLDVSKADGIFSLFANRNGRNAEIKVWEDFNLADPESQGFYVDSKITLVYQFSE